MLTGCLHIRSSTTPNSCIAGVGTLTFSQPKRQRYLGPRDEEGVLQDLLERELAILQRHMPTLNFADIEYVANHATELWGAGGKS